MNVSLCEDSKLFTNQSLGRSSWRHLSGSPIYDASHCIAHALFCQRWTDTSVQALNVEEASAEAWWSGGRV